MVIQEAGICQEGGMAASAGEQHDAHHGLVPAARRLPCAGLPSCLLLLATSVQLHQSDRPPLQPAEPVPLPVPAAEVKLMSTRASIP